jgi:hypothetical protein
MNYTFVLDCIYLLKTLVQSSAFAVKISMTNISSTFKHLKMKLILNC